MEAERGKFLIGDTKETEVFNLRFKVIPAPASTIAAWIKACHEMLDDEEALLWYLNARMRRLPLDVCLSARENLLAHNLMKVRPFPCTPDMQ
jgi:hypothetical protein